MKKSLLLVLTSVLLIGCATKSNSNNSSASSLSSSPIEDSSSDFSSDFESSKNSSSSISSNGGQEEIEQVISGELAQQLVIYASSVDILKAKTSTDLILSKGQDNGVRYEQNQSVNYTSYSNDITIGEGSLTHIQGGKTYTDTFDHVKMVKDYTLIDAKAYHNHVFNDETQKVFIILNGVDITCSVAPAIIFKNAYECDLFCIELLTKYEI